MTLPLGTPISITKHRFRDEQEEQQSQLLDDIHKYSIQNLMTDIILEKANMDAEIDGYLLKQKYLKGQLDILQYLLALDQTARIAST